MSRVLIIEDDPQMLSLLVCAVESERHEVRGVANGMEGLRQAAVWPAQIILTDILMPEMDGLEVIMTFRQRYPSIRIIAMSGGGRVESSDYMLLAQRLGAHRALQKPFGMSDLLDAIAREELESVLSVDAGHAV